MYLLFCHPYKHHTDQLNLDNTREVLDLMWDYRAKWRFIGITLGIDASTLDAIETDNTEVEGCLTKVITTWLRGVNPRPTRSAMKAALRSKQVTGQTGTYSAFIYLSYL